MRIATCLSPISGRSGGAAHALQRHRRPAVRQATRNCCMTASASLPGDYDQPPRPASARGWFFTPRTGKTQDRHRSAVPAAPVRKSLPGGHRNLPLESAVLSSSLQPGMAGDGDAPLTYVRFCRENAGHFFSLVFPPTGRTHQIPRHFQDGWRPCSAMSVTDSAPATPSCGCCASAIQFFTPPMAKRRSASCPIPGGKPWGWPRYRWGEAERRSALPPLG